MNVIHRDLKLANILIHFPFEDFTFPGIKDLKMKKKAIQEKLRSIDLVKSAMQVKIADLGFARELNHGDMAETVCGTPLVMAPEILNKKKYNHKVDVWSLGIVFFELLTGFTPFKGRDKNDLIKNLDEGLYKLPKNLKLTL